MNRSVTISFVSLFVVMLGFSVTLAVLPVRLGSAGLDLAGSAESVAFHVGALTGVYALAQFVAAPFWGRWSDRYSRRLVLICSLMGFGASNVLFGLSTDLSLLYISRILGGLFSAAVFPIATGAVAASFPRHRQPQGMAWLNASASLGVVAGPALSGLASRWDLKTNFMLGQVEVSGFSVPFLALGIISVVLSIIVLVEQPRDLPAASHAIGRSADTWGDVARRIRGILVLVVASQIAMALFMTAFALYADAQLNFEPHEIGTAFALCGLLTASVQVGIFWAIARRWDEHKQVLWGSLLMAVGLLLVPITPSLIPLFGTISLFVVGAAVVATSLLSLVAKACPQSVGAAAGLEGSATYLGQVLGPVMAGILFAWDWSVPFYAGAGLMLAATVFWVIKPRISYSLPEKESVR